MKIAKLFSAAVASVVAAGAISAVASADITFPAEHDPGLSGGTGDWLVQIFNTGNEAEGKPAVDYGIDPSAIAKITVTIKATDPTWFDGGIGGGLIPSCGPASATPADHNWPQAEYWGVLDEDLGIETLATDKPVQLEKVGDYTYMGTLVLDDTNCIYDVRDIEGGYVQIGFKEWSGALNEVTVTDLTCYDASGNVLLSFDGQGYRDDGGASAPAAPAEDSTAPAEDNTAPAENSASTPAPAASTGANKGSPNTGVEGVAAVAGIALAAAGAVVLAKKRK